MFEYDVASKNIFFTTKKHIVRTETNKLNTFLRKIEDAKCFGLFVFVRTCILPQLAPKLVFVMASRKRISGQPVCPSCNSRLLATLTPTFWTQWQRFESVCWSWHSGSLAFWHLCVPCHNEAYSHLPRVDRANRYNSAPVVAVWWRRGGWALIQLPINRPKAADINRS